MSRLENKTAVVTGASSGIGAGIALAYAREGASVAINFNTSADKAHQVVEQIRSAGGQAMTTRADISKEDEVQKLIDTVMAEWGHIDIWVNNAGADILTGEGADLDDRQKFQALIDVDLKGTIDCCRAIQPIMTSQGEGVIINMSWDLAMHGFRGRNPEMFAAAKAGIIGFSRAFAKSIAPAIRVNVLAPGWIYTAFAEEVMEDEYYQARIREIPLGRFGRPEDVAETAVFLASDASSYITGEIININGGLI